MSSNHQNGNQSQHSWGRRAVKIGAALIFLFLGGFTGWMLRGLSNIEPVALTYDDPALRLKDPKYQHIDPLLSCSSPSAAAYSGFQEYKPLETDINRIIAEKQYAGEVESASVYFKDLKLGRWVSVNDNEKYFPASMLKVPVMIAYFKIAQSNPEGLSQKIFYDGSFDDNKKENFKPKKFIEPNKSYMVDELIDDMIAYSDNNATRLLFENLDKASLNEVFTDIGLNFLKAGENLDYMSVKDYAFFFRILYNATYLNREMSEKAMRLLTQSESVNGIRTGLPADVTVAQKFGESELVVGGRYKKELHDCGIVFYPNAPYLLCVMTRGNNFDKLAVTIQDVSKLVYQWRNSPSYKNNNP